MNKFFPLGWELLSLEEIFEFRYGKGLPQEKRNKMGPVRVYGSNGVLGNHDVALSKGPTIIVGRKGSVGEVHFTDESCWPIDTTYFIDDFPANLPPKYWVNFLKSLHLGQQEKSSAIPGISRNDIYALEVPLPPLAEQRRIVAKLEILLGKADACRARLERIPALLKRFRQSVLSAACSDLLTHTLKGNGLPKSWNDYALGELISEVRTGPFGSSLHKSDYVSGGIPVINPANILDGSIVPNRNISVPPRVFNRLSDYSLKENDIIIARRGEMGRCAIITKKENGWLCGTGAAILRFKTNVLPAFMQIVISSPSAISYLKEVSVGSTMDNLNQQAIKEMPISLPPLPVQQEIVRRVEALFALADKIEARHKKAKLQVDRLTQSILAKAFRGELVPQDPNDEPASRLLERILGEKAKSDEIELGGKKKRHGARLR